MINTEVQKPKDINNQFDQLSSSLPIKRYPIICKFWMMGNCLKDEKCEYLHSEREKRGLSFNRSIVDNHSECPMYTLGFCKNGSMCNFKHTERKIEPSEDETLPELPVWYLEYVMEKPISLIFQEFEEQNKGEVEAMMKRCRNLKHYHKHKNNKMLTVQANQYHNNGINNLKYSYQANHHNYLTGHQPYDIYADKKDFIIHSLGKKVRYFFIRNINMIYVKLAMEFNCLINIKQNSIKLREAQKSCDEVILIMFDEHNLNFNGFCKYKKEMTENDVEYSSMINNPIISDLNLNQNTSYLKIEWHWKTKLSHDKLELLRNPLNNDETIIESKDCQEISSDVGNYICRLMIKRLSKNEVKEYLEKRRICEDALNNSILIDKDENNSVSNNTSRSNISNINLNNLIFEEIHKKNLNQSLLFQSNGNNNNCDNRSINTNISNNNIIVTNISNLQVNISQNSYQSSSSKYAESKDMGKIKKRNNRSRSRSRDLKYVKPKKDRRRTRSRSYKRHDYKLKKHRRKYSDENDRNYDSDETVKVKEEFISNKNSHGVSNSSYKLYKEKKFDDFKRELINNNNVEKYKNIPEPLCSENLNVHLESKSKHNDNKMMKNPLFSHAMKKIAMQSSIPK